MYEGLYLTKWKGKRIGCELPIHSKETTSWFIHPLKNGLFRSYFFPEGIPGPYFRVIIMHLAIALFWWRKNGSRTSYMYLTSLILCT